VGNAHYLRAAPDLPVYSVNLNRLDVTSSGNEQKMALYRQFWQPKFIV